MCDTHSMLRLGTEVMGVHDVDRAVTCWSQALGCAPVRFPDAGNGFTIVVPPSGEGTRKALRRSQTPTREHPRVHLILLAGVIHRCGSDSGSSSTLPNRPDTVTTAITAPMDHE